MLDASFAALADGTRRRVLERLGRGDASISDLAGAFGMTLTGMKKHVRVLEDAGLVTTEKVGRVRQCRLGPRRLVEETAWIATYQSMLEARYDRLGAFLERIARTFEWDGMPGHVAVETITLEDLGDGRTRLVSVSLFHTTAERDGMLGSGMEGGVNESFAALDRVLATMA